MNRLIAAVAFAAVVAAPAFAQGPTQIDSGNIVGASSAPSQVAPHQSRVVRQARPRETYGQRWPGARYDQNGYYIDPNSPGRW
ncbi:MAG: hypothetical protein ACJ8D0_22550 [Xanthobacteraceae bacterium]